MQSWWDLENQVVVSMPRNVQLVQENECKKYGEAVGPSFNMEGTEPINDPCGRECGL